ncbi:MAG: PH domain-containing protein [Euryarchaeota archaeon]|nr:PH domain-containing protein [Euryarchaeota archaeon]
MSNDALPAFVQKNLDPNEQVLHTLKKRLRIEAKPKWLVVTNRRILFIDEKLFGRYDLFGIPYEKLETVEFKAGIVASRFRVTKEDGKKMELSWLSKEEAKGTIQTIRNALNEIAVEPITIQKKKGLKSEEWKLNKPRETVSRFVGAGGPKKSTSGKDSIEKLKGLKELYDKGIISKIEYEAKRKKFLDEL